MCFFIIFLSIFLIFNNFLSFFSYIFLSFLSVLGLYSHARVGQLPPLPPPQNGAVTCQGGAAAPSAPPWLRPCIRMKQNPIMIFSNRFFMQLHSITTNFNVEVTLNMKLIQFFQNQKNYNDTIFPFFLDSKLFSSNFPKTKASSRYTSSSYT